MKTCTKCKEVKPFTQFDPGTGKHHLNSWCKSCMAVAKQTWRQNNQTHRTAKWRPKNFELLRERKHVQWLKATCGMTADQYQSMLDEQDGLCAICHHPEKAKRPDGTAAKMSVDQDYTTGQIRGLLCRRCKLAIGHLDDDPGKLARAIHYLLGDDE